MYICVYIYAYACMYVCMLALYRCGCINRQSLCIYQDALLLAAGGSRYGGSSAAAGVHTQLLRSMEVQMLKEEPPALKLLVHVQCVDLQRGAKEA